MKTNYFVTIILLISALSANSQEMHCNIVPISYPKDITGISVVSVDNYAETQRFFLCNTANQSRYYVFDSDNMTFEVAHVSPGFQIIGFKGNILIEYNMSDDSIVLVNYPTKRIIQCSTYSNDYIKILKYVGRKGFSTFNTRLSISQNGVLAFVNQEKSVVTLMTYKSDTLSRLDIPIHFDHGLFQWIDTNNLLIANANVIDDCGTMAFNAQTYNYDTKTIFPDENESKAFVEGIFCYFKKGYIFKMGNNLMFGEELLKPTTSVTLPGDIQYVYDVSMLSKNRILLTAELNKLDNCPFLIFETNQH